MATLREIAAAAGVPKSAVSYVLRGRAAEGRISQQRAEHIIKVAKELGYRPNAYARAVSTGRFNAIALMFRRSSVELPLTLLRGIDDELERCGYHLNLAHVTQKQFDELKLLPKSLRELCVDGALGFHQLDIPGKVVEMLRQLRIPTVWLNAETGVDCVYPDEMQAFLKTTRDLISLGHKRIAYVHFGLHHKQAGGHSHYSMNARRGGYTEAMRQAGLSAQIIDRSYTPSGLSGGWGGPDDDRLAFSRSLLSQPDRPTAVIAPTFGGVEPIAVAAVTLGLRLPQDLSLVGLNWVPLHTTGIPISTLVVPLAEVGRLGVIEVLRKIENPAVALPGVVVPFSDPVGGTIGPAPA